MTNYRYNAALTALLSCVVIGLVPLTLYMFISFVRSVDPLGVSLAALVSLVPILLFRSLLSRASIAVDNRRIAACVLGIETKAIRWEDIKKVRKVRVTNGYAYVDSFHVMDRKPRNLICRLFVNLCGDIVFTQDISDLRSLLQQLNFYAQQHEILLVVWDTEAAVDRFRTKSGTRYWRQAVAKIEEVKVVEF
jgi:hypothetical protein